MKRIISLSICLILLISIAIPSTVYADNKTLKDYKNELATLKQKQAQNKALTNAAKNDIDSRRDAIDEANNNITQNEQNVEAAKQKVIDSQNEINTTTEELYDVLNYMQTVDEEQVYLKFVIESDSIADLIERSSIVEQISNYQKEKIEQLKQLIIENEQLQVDLTNENANLEKSITEYESKIDELQTYISSLASVGLDYAEQIKAQEQLIKSYEDAGCSDNDSIDTCYYSKIAGSSKFVKPLASGRVTQAYGNNGHNGIDLGGNAAGTSVYASANGVVASVSYHNSCGGNIIYIHHTVAGKAYTTEYAHLKEIYVKVGQTVTISTKIGAVGGDKSTFYYDKCTTGTHLHYAIAYGHYLGSGTYGYTSWSTWKKNATATGITSISGYINKKNYTWSSRY